jgi:hypothetical protein
MGIPTFGERRGFCFKFSIEKVGIFVGIHLKLCVCLSKFNKTKVQDVCLSNIFIIIDVWLAIHLLQFLEGGDALESTITRDEASVI